MQKKSRLIVLCVMALMPPVGVVLMSMSGQLKKIVQPRPTGPCDIYAAGGSPCVAAHSSTRALYASYNGPLYQVLRESDGKTMDIGLVQPTDSDPGGYANAAAQDAFCANATCVITKIYDQSGKGNPILQAPPGTFKGPAKGGFNTLPIADMAPVTISGHKAYGIYIMPGMGLRNNNAADVAINDEPEGIYYVIDGKHYDSGCCFDYGNSSTNGRAVGTGTMETTYYGTSTVWGSGNGPGPWIMSDMEAGLFSGFNAKKNNVPSIDSWRFVTAFVDGGGGNRWDLRGGNAQKGPLTTFYDGVRPASPASNAYYPMNKKGGILLGTGGDNGNGSSGTFYEGVMTKGYPSAATTDAVQANVVAARYDVPRLGLSRVTTFTPQSAQNVTVTFTNTTGAPVKALKLSMSGAGGWKAVVPGSAKSTKTFAKPLTPDASVSATFKLTSPANISSGFVTVRAEWLNHRTGLQVETTSARLRNALPVKINEVRFGTGQNANNQFIELYNASAREVNIANWRIINTRSGMAPILLGKIPAGAKIPAHGFYLLGLSASGLAAPAKSGDNIINVQNTSGMAAGQQVNIDGETRVVAKVGTPAARVTTLFIPVSAGSWLTIPPGATNLPVTSAPGFVAGEKIGIDEGGNYEVATVTSVGKGATQTNLSAAANAGDLTIKLVDNASMTTGDTLTISTGARMEQVKVKRIVNAVTAPPRGAPAGEPGVVELESPLKRSHMIGVDVMDAGTGVSFSPATRFTHKSGDALQALGSGVVLQQGLASNHAAGAPIVITGNTASGYQGLQQPNQWFGTPLSSIGGSIVLTDASGTVIVDALVFGSQQSNSSANGIIASPEIATLEGDQSQGGCIVVLPGSGRGTATGDRSVGRFPDGYDSDHNCKDFQTQSSVPMAAGSAPGSYNIKVAAVTGFSSGQNVTIGSGADSETAVIKTVGTPGSSTTGGVTPAGAATIALSSITAFEPGQAITIGTDADRETAVVASVQIKRFTPGEHAGSPEEITLTAPLKNAHAADTPVAGSGITFISPLKKAHNMGAQVVSALPTPGKANGFMSVSTER